MYANWFAKVAHMTNNDKICFGAISNIFKMGFLPMNNHYLFTIDESVVTYTEDVSFAIPSNVFATLEPIKLSTTDEIDELITQIS